MKTFIITLALTLPVFSSALAADAKTEPKYYANDKAVTKVEALMTLARDPNAKVVRCNDLTLSDKGTLKNKK